MSADGGAAESEGDPTLAPPYVTINLATQITFDTSTDDYTTLCLLRISACWLLFTEDGISSISRLRPHGFARLVTKNEAVVWWLCA